MKRRIIYGLVVFCSAVGSAGAEIKEQNVDEESSQYGVVVAEEGHHEEFILVAPLTSTSLFLIDSKGELRHEWKSKDRTSRSSYLLENGDVIRMVGGQLRGARPGTYTERGRIQRISPRSQLLWDWRFKSRRSIIHHDIEPLPNGNLLVLVRDHKTREEAIAAGRKPDLVSSDGLWIDGVMEVQPVGAAQAKILWRWSAWDHLVQNVDPEKPNYGEPAEHPDRIDINYVLENDANWLHFNSVDFHEELGQMAISVRDICEAWNLNYPTVTEAPVESDNSSRRRREIPRTLGELGQSTGILYRWGNPEAWGKGTASDRILQRQHDVRWIPAEYPGEGNLTVFSNGAERPAGEYSSLHEWSPLIGKAKAAGDAEPHSQILGTPKQSFFSERMSGAQKLSNGNMIVCSSAQGRIFEITSDGEVVWEFRHPIPDRSGDSRVRRSAFSPVVLPHGQSQFDGWMNIGGRVFKVSAYKADYPGIARLIKHEG